MSSTNEKTTLCNVAVAQLRKRTNPTTDKPYTSFTEWAGVDGNVYIGRRIHYVGAPQSKWANPYALKDPNDDAERELVLEKYRVYVLADKTLMGALEELRGKTLGCWCRPKRCHGDILIQLLGQIGQK